MSAARPAEQRRVLGNRRRSVQPGGHAAATKDHCSEAGASGAGLVRPVCSRRAAESGTRNCMNRFEKLLGLKGEARLRYLDGEFQVLSPGDFVRCAVTGQTIMLPELRYWSVELQEPYASAEISFERYLAVKGRAQR